MSLLLTRRKCHTMPTSRGPVRVDFGLFKSESEMKITFTIFKKILVTPELSSLFFILILSLKLIFDLIKKLLMM